MSLLTYQLNHVVALDPPGPQPAELPEGVRLAPLDAGGVTAMQRHPAREVRTAASFATPARRG
ncbi:MAG: hypothetical protein ACK40H_00255 [Sphingomonadaceae bacterium]